MMEEKHELSLFEQVAFDSLREANPDIPNEKLEEIARAAAKAAKDHFGEMIEDGADPWAVREQILDDLSHLGSSQEVKNDQNN